MHGLRVRNNHNTASPPCINRGATPPPSRAHTTREQEEKKSFILTQTLARIIYGVREGRVGEVPGLSATSPSVLATLNGRSVGASNSSTCTSTIILLLESKKFVFYFGIDILRKVIFVHYKLAGSSSVLMTVALVEDS